MAKKKEAKAGGRKVREVLRGRGYALHLATERDEDAFTVTLELTQPEDRPPVVILEGAGRRQDGEWTLTFSLSEAEAWKLLLRLLDRLGGEEE